MTNLEYLNLVMESDFPLDEKYDEKCLQKLKTCTKKESNVCMDLIRVYHPSIWRCNVQGHLAPVDAWNDPESMLKVINNRMKYLNTDILSPLNIRAGLSISKIAPKVSIFKPALAKYLIQTYLNDYCTIFDPCSGFSGRMLGALSLNKKYIGQDINSITVCESNQLISDLKLSAEIKLKNSLYDYGEYECLFTCPPYADKKGNMIEIWHQDIEPIGEDEWIETCLKNYKCKAYLFVVGNTERYKDSIVETLSNKSHFSNKKEFVIFIKA